MNLICRSFDCLLQVSVLADFGIDNGIKWSFFSLERERGRERESKKVKDKVGFIGELELDLQSI